MSYMDRDWGAKAGGGGVASDIQAKVDRRERLRQLALQTVDLQKDPYFMKNHLGQYECKLCLTLHMNEGAEPLPRQRDAVLCVHGLSALACIVPGALRDPGGPGNYLAHTQGKRHQYNLG